MTPGPKNGQKNFDDPWGSKMTREPIIIKKKNTFSASGFGFVYRLLRGHRLYIHTYT